MKLEAQFSNLGSDYEVKFLWLSYEVLDSMIREKTIVSNIEFAMD